MGLATLSTEMAQYLESKGVGNYEAAGTGAPGEPVNLFVEWMPDKPDVALGLYTSSGGESSAGEGEDQPQLMVRIRGTRDARTALAKAEAAYNALHAMGDTLLAGGTQLIYCLGIQSGFNRLGVDEAGRHLYTCNFRTMILNPTTNRTPEE
jgi:hypothetical protein